MSGHIAGALERAVVEGKMDSQNRQWRLVRRPEGLLRGEDVELRPGDEDRRPLQPGPVRVRNLLFLYAPTMRHWMSARSDRLHEIIPLGSPVKTPADGRIVESLDPRNPVGSRFLAMSFWCDTGRARWRERGC